MDKLQAGVHWKQFVADDLQPSIRWGPQDTVISLEETDDTCASQIPGIECVVFPTHPDHVMARINTKGPRWTHHVPPPHDYYYYNYYSSFPKFIVSKPMTINSLIFTIFFATTLIKIISIHSKLHLGVFFLLLFLRRKDFHQIENNKKVNLYIIELYFLNIG